MRTYFTFIQNTQEFLMALSIVVLCTLPASLVLNPEWFTNTTYFWLYSIAHFSLFLVMMIRPLADILHGVTWLRPLVILRKGLGVLSASIIVSFILSKIIIDAPGYLGEFMYPEYWSFTNLAIFAHLADISAILLLITSNKLSKRILGKNWKRIQRLSYVYFYGSAMYVIFILNETHVALYVLLVTIVTIMAWLRNRGYILKNSNVIPA